MFSKKIYPENELLDDYLAFLRDYQCLSEATVVVRRNFVTPFLSKMSYSTSFHLASLTGKIIHDYITEAAPSLHRASKKHLSSSIRNFLRFAYIKGYLTRNLAEVVPVMITRKLSQLPESPTWEEVQSLLSMPDKNTPLGRRDLAVMMLCIHYGVRIGQVTALKLQDIHWEEGFIYFAGRKWSNSLRLPLLQDVAEALLSYIEKDRKDADFDEVFLTIKGNPRPLSPHNHYSSGLKKYYKRAGISGKYQSSRHLRHAFATRLISQEVSIKTIADLLGHRHIETTFIYTKVDTSQLLKLARDWPEESK